MEEVGNKISILDNIQVKYGNKSYTYNEEIYKPLSNELYIKNYEKYDSIAEQMYSGFRKSNADISSIVEKTGWEIEDIEIIKNHLFLDKVEKWNGAIEFLDPDYEIAVAWQRLINGNYYENDILLLQHELYEATYMKLYQCT